MKEYFNIFLIFVLLILCIYSCSYYNNYYPSLSSYLNNKKYEEQVSENCGRMGNSYDHGFELMYGKDKIFVKTNEKIKRPYMGFICVVGKYSNNTILMQRYYLTNYSHIKYFISFLAFIIFIFIFFKEWKINELKLRERKKCLIG